MSNPEEEKKLTPEQHRRWQRLGDDIKKFGKWYFIGTIAILAFGIIGPIGNLLGIKDVNIDHISSTSDLYVLLTHTSPATALFVFASVVSVGGVVVFLVASQMKFGKLVHLKNDAVITDAVLDKEIKDKLKKLRVLPLAIFGVYMGIIFVPVAAVVFIATGVNLGNIHSFLGAYYSGNVFVIALVSSAVAFYAYMMKHFENEYEKVFNKIEPYVNKAKFL